MAAQITAANTRRQREIDANKPSLIGRLLKLILVCALLAGVAYGGKAFMEYREEQAAIRELEAERVHFMERNAELEAINKRLEKQLARS